MNIYILLHLVGFLQPRITMHGTTNMKSERHTFLKGINEVSPTFYTFLTRLVKFTAGDVHINVLCNDKLRAKWPCETL